MKIGRREFLGTVGSGLAALAQETEKRNGIPYRTLGRTGEKVSVVGLGGYHIGNPGEQEGIRIIRTAIDRGVNFMDNCWDYHDGESERRMGKALRDGYRQKVFLMTKIDGQVKDAAEKQLNECLERLQTDMIDLVQFHEVIRPGDPDRIFGPDGSFETLMAAKKAGKIRFIGFTGHKDPEIHLKMIQTGLDHHYTFDTVQMPLNVMDAHYDSFGAKVLPVLEKHNIGVLGMKPLGGGIILKSQTVQPVEALHYAMNLPTDVVITGCESIERLEQAIKAATSFQPMNRQEVSRLLAKTETAARKGEFERYKTTGMFDGTVQNPQWLG